MGRWGWRTRILPTAPVVSGGSITAITLFLQSRGGYVGFQILLLLSPARLKRLPPDPRLKRRGLNHSFRFCLATADIRAIALLRLRQPARPSRQDAPLQDCRYRLWPAWRGATLRRGQPLPRAFAAAHFPVSSALISAICRCFSPCFSNSLKSSGIASSQSLPSFASRCPL